MNLRNVWSIANNMVLYLKKNKTKLIVRAIVGGGFLLQSTMMDLSMPRDDFEQVSPVTYNAQTTINL